MADTYRQALEEIAALAHVTQWRGGDVHWLTPDHMLDEDGYGPIHPAFKRGLEHAARIAQKSLDREAL